MSSPRSAVPAPDPRLGRRAAAKQSSAIVVYVLLLVSLQIFLLVVAVEGLLGNQPGLARAAAVLSLVLFGSAVAMRWFIGED